MGVDIQPPLWYYNNRKGKVIKMRNTLKQFFETDFAYVKVGMAHETDPKRRREIGWNARQRALGAIDMAQRCGLGYDVAEAMFNDYCEKLKGEEENGKMC